MVRNVSVSHFNCHSDSRGDLYVAEYLNELPFLVKRVYYICNVKDEKITRGSHAHKKLRQVMICLGGRCDIIVDDGKERKTIVLDKPGKAIIIEPGVWRDMTNFSNNATLMVLASDNYNEDDYIRDYGEYLRYIKENQL